MEWKNWLEKAEYNIVEKNSVEQFTVAAFHAGINKMLHTAETRKMLLINPTFQRSMNAIYDKGDELTGGQVQHLGSWLNARFAEVLHHINARLAEQEREKKGQKAW